MKVSDLIGMKMVHTTAPEITGNITDVLFGFSLQEAAFFLADVTTRSGTAPVLFSPSVLVLERNILKISAHPDDVAAPVDASMHRTTVAVDPADLPSTFIGPFGNTFSPSMIAALFNARTAVEQTEPPMQHDGVWFSELQNHPVRAHVADIGHVGDMVLDDHFLRCEGIEITTTDGTTKTVSSAAINAARSSDNTLLLTIVQPEDSIF